MSTAAANRTELTPYTSIVDDLPEATFLGSLIFFSISKADVHLDSAHRHLKNLGLPAELMRQELQPRDAFAKAANRFAKKWQSQDGFRSELMVRKVGEERGTELFRYLILERLSVAGAKKKQVFYEKVGELRFDKGHREHGQYVGHGVESLRINVGKDGRPFELPLNEGEDQWLTEQLATFEDNYDHLLHYMDSHAVRTFVREFIYRLSGTCVKESGGLYFVAQNNVPDVAKLAKWVESIGSQFHSLPLLNLTDQRDMILNAFEDEAVKEVDRLMGEVTKILSDPGRTIETKTFDAYGLRAADLAKKVGDYNNRLGTRADRAEHSVGIFAQQILQLASRIKPDKSSTATPVVVAP